VGNHRRQPLAKTEIKNLSFDDEEALAKLNEAIAQLSELQQAYPGAARFGYTTRVQREDSHPKAAAAEIYLSGKLAVDFPEDVKIPVEPNQMVTAELVGNSLKFSYCDLGRAIAFLNEQFVVGTVEIKVVRQ
jgi:inner membrane protein